MSRPPGTARTTRTLLRDAGLPLLVYTAAAVWFTWPLASVAADHVVTSSPSLLNDLHLVIWILSWVGRALTSAPLTLFDGNVLHPSPHVVARSEHLLGDMPIFLPVWLATDDAILALNVLTLASFVLSALAMHFLARRWTGSTAAAWAAGFAFGFAPWRGDLGRAHLMQVQYLPMIAWGLDRAVATGSTGTAIATAALLAVQVLCSYYLGYAAYVVVGSFVVTWIVVEWTRPRAAGAWRALAIAVAGPLLVVVPVSVPYVLARASGGLTTELTRSLATPWEEVGRPMNVLGGFVGWGTALLAIAFLSSRLVPRGSRCERDRLRIAFLVLAAAAGVLLAAGPEGFLGGWFAPYAWLYALVPGFRSLRVPVRFAIVTSFALSALAAYGVADAERRLAAWRPGAARVVAGAVGVLVCASWVVASPWHLAAYPVATRAQMSPAHPWLAENGGGRPLLELPTDRVFRLADARAMVASTHHWLPLVNGYTGYMPPGSAFLLEHARQLPSPESLRILVDCADPGWILVHDAPAARRNAWRDAPGVQLEKTFPGADGDRGDDLYRVTLPRSGACPGLQDRARTVTGAPVATIDTPRGVLKASVQGALSPHREGRVVLELRNDGEVTWPGTAVDPDRRFAVWYAWRPTDGTPPAAWRRISLPDDVPRGATVSLAAWIAPPGSVGRRVLALRAGQGSDPVVPLTAELEVDVRAPVAGAPSS